MSGQFQLGDKVLRAPRAQDDGTPLWHGVNSAGAPDSSRRASPVVSAMRPVDAIVVLGCMVGPNGEPSSALRRRLTLATMAYRKQLAPTVIASGGRRWNGHAEASVMKRVLEGAGVPESAIIAELCSLSTLENSYYCASLMNERGFRRVILVSCFWHMPRALSNFRYWGVDAMAPPGAWFEGPAASLTLRLRERLCTWLDRGMAASLRQRDSR